MEKNKQPRVAIVHDFVTYFGGAEQVLKSLHNIYPQAPIFTLMYEDEMKKYFPGARFIPSFVDSFPSFIRKRKKFLLPLFPSAIESFDLGQYDLVISSSSSFSKGVIVRPKTLHICYCHAPTRFLWDWHLNYLEENKIGFLKKLFVSPILHFMRIWDRMASDRVDVFIANSKNTSRKIKKFYRKDSTVIYPPVDMQNKKSKENNENIIGIKNYYLIVSRLSPYKKIDVAIHAFNKMGMDLVIVGEGEDRKRLEKMSEKHIHFLGFQDEEKLKKIYSNCRAFVFPGEDDFGISVVEAMSFGKPVLALRKGGSTETVIEGVTGEFFDSCVAEILADGIRRIEKNIDNYDSEEIANHAEIFSREVFEKKIRDFVEKSFENYKNI